MSSGHDPRLACDANGHFNGNNAFRRTGALHEIQNLILRFGGRPSNFSFPANYVNLYNELAHGYPVIMHIRSGWSTSHVIVIRGMRFIQNAYGFEPELIVNDPMNHYTQPVPFSQLAPLWINAIVVR
jgi:hypothetical protein